MKLTSLLFVAGILCTSFSIAQTKELTNEKIWFSGEFSSSSVRGINSMNDGIHYTSLEYDKNGRSFINQSSYETGRSTGIILKSTDIFGKSLKNIEGYSFSKNESKLLIETGKESIYRHSYMADYHIYDIDSKSTIAINSPNDGKIRLAEFSPNGENVAFVKENNLYCYNVNSQETTQITKDGEYNKIINGYPDWVYEEEFGFNKGFNWSPNSDRIAFYRFDETEVRQFNMEYYTDELYPDPYQFKYPKAGEKNSIVSIHIYDLGNKSTRPVNLGEETDIYIPRIKWSNDNNGLCIMRMNRHQNELEFLLTDLTQKNLGPINPRIIFKEKSTTYIEVHDDLTFLQDGKSFIWMSERNGYNHLYKYTMVPSGKVQQLTTGEWDVISFLGIDEKNEIFYYTSSQQSPLESHVYKKGVKSRVFKKLSRKRGNNSAVFSSTFEYYINYYSNANKPSLITLNNNQGREIRILEDNAALNRTLLEYDLPKKEFFTFNNTNGDLLNCWMIKPKNFDESKKYPVFVTIYGGPGRNTVKDSWGGSNYLWHQLIAQKGYIVISCDPRGTMYRGKDFKHSTYQQLGKYETEDFIDLAKHMQTLSYVDGDRIGMQGWSYGGYMTALCMTKGADYYKAGIAVAPVTNWKWYDTIYTERFMRTPEENQDGYEDNSPTNHVEKLKGSFLIVHGSGDDNVHAQNTMEMVNALVNANKEFDMFIYPNKNHGIYGGPTRLNLFTKMTRFIEENL